jgi:hypothetical protein
MHALIKQFEKGRVSRESIESTLTAYQFLCQDAMRSKARDEYIRILMKDNKNAKS